MSVQMQFMERVTGENLEKTQTVSAGLQLVLDEPVADAVSNFEVAFALVVADVQAFFLVADGDILLETNNGTTPDDTMSLLENVPYFWHANSYHAFLFGTDITSLFFTNASGAVVNVKCYALVDPSP